MPTSVTHVSLSLFCCRCSFSFWPPFFLPLLLWLIGAFSHLCVLCCVAVAGQVVWHDVNGDGVQQEDEPGLQGVAIVLTDPSTGTILATVFTDSNGRYMFPVDLPAGLYGVAVDTTTVPAGFETTTGSPAVVVELAAGQTVLDANFGFQPEGLPFSVSQTVFEDANGDGIQQEGELGVPGVRVELRDPVTGVVVASTVTSASGTFEFPVSGLTAGKQYSIVVDSATLPTDVVLTTLDSVRFVVAPGLGRLPQGFGVKGRFGCCWEAGGQGGMRVRVCVRLGRANGEI